MKQLNGLISLIILYVTGSVLWSCDGTENGKLLTSEKDQSSDPLAHIEILPYMLSDSLTVTQIRTLFVAREKDSAFTLVVQASRKNQTFMDSVHFALKKDDTARASMVFTRLPYDEGNPPDVHLIYH